MGRATCSEDIVACIADPFGQPGADCDAVLYEDRLAAYCVEDETTFDNNCIDGTHGALGAIDTAREQLALSCRTRSNTGCTQPITGIANDLSVADCSANPFLTTDGCFGNEAFATERMRFAMCSDVSMDPFNALCDIESNSAMDTDTQTSIRVARGTICVGLDVGARHPRCGNDEGTGGTYIQAYCNDGGTAAKNNHRDCSNTAYAGENPEVTDVSLADFTTSGKNQPLNSTGTALLTGDDGFQPTTVSRDTDKKANFIISFTDGLHLNAPASNGAVVRQIPVDVLTLGHLETTPAPTDDGFAIGNVVFDLNSQRLYVGILSDTDLGSPVTDAANGTWTGRLNLAVEGIGQPNGGIGHHFDIILNVDVNGKTITQTGTLPDITAVVSSFGTINIDGKFTANGVIYGTVDFGAKDGNKTVATLTGLIGAEGAVGVFASNTDATTAYVGGFVAKKSDVAAECLADAMPFGVGCDVDTVKLQLCGGPIADLRAAGGSPDVGDCKTPTLSGAICGMVGMAGKNPFAPICFESAALVEEFTEILAAAGRKEFAEQCASGGITTNCDKPANGVIGGNGVTAGVSIIDCTKNPYNITDAPNSCSTNPAFAGLLATRDMLCNTPATAFHADCDIEKESATLMSAVESIRLARGEACATDVPGTEGEACGDENDGDTYVGIYCAETGGSPDAMNNLTHCPRRYAGANDTAVTEVSVAEFKASGQNKLLNATGTGLATVIAAGEANDATDDPTNFIELGANGAPLTVGDSDPSHGEIRTGGLTLMDDGLNGFVFAKNNGNKIYVGLLNTTNLGAPFRSDSPASATWDASLRVLSFNGSQFLSTEADFKLLISYGGTDTDNTLAITGGDPSLGTLGAFSIANGKFTNNGVIYGEVNFANTDAGAGTLTGLIGQAGAVGIFKSNAKTTATPASIAYVGGFITAPDTANVADWTVALGAGSLLVEGEAIALNSGNKRFLQWDGARRFALDGANRLVAERTDTLLLSGEIGDVNNGLAFAYHTDNQSFVGLLSDTDVGVVEYIPASAVWHGTLIGSIRRNSRNTAFRDDGFVLNITYNGGSSGNVGSVSSANKRFNTELAGQSVAFIFNGGFNAQGVISGQLNYTLYDSGQTLTQGGSFNGLIGDKGAIGVFVNSSGLLYAGGFIATPDDSPESPKPFTTWTGSFDGQAHGGETLLPATTKSNEFAEGEAYFVELDADNQFGLQTTSGSPRVYPTTPLYLDNGTDEDGIGFTRRDVGAVKGSFAGLLATTDLGAPLFDNSKNDAIWTGEIAGAANGVDLTKTSFRLKVTYGADFAGGVGTLESIANGIADPAGSSTDPDLDLNNYSYTAGEIATGYVGVQGSNGYNGFRFVGGFDARGLITGTVAYYNRTLEESASGRFNGLIGVDGAVAVFKSDAGTAENLRFVGGFVASEFIPEPACLATADPFGAGCGINNAVEQVKACIANNAAAMGVGGADFNTNCATNAGVTARVCATAGTYSNPFNAAICTGNQDDNKLGFVNNCDTGVSATGEADCSGVMACLDSPFGNACTGAEYTDVRSDAIVLCAANDSPFDSKCAEYDDKETQQTQYCLDTQTVGDAFCKDGAVDYTTAICTDTVSPPTLATKPFATLCGGNDGTTTTAAQAEACRLSPDADGNNCANTIMAFCGTIATPTSTAANLFDTALCKTDFETARSNYCNDTAGEGDVLCDTGGYITTICGAGDGTNVFATLCTNANRVTFCTTGNIFDDRCGNNNQYGDTNMARETACAVAGSGMDDQCTATVLRICDTEGKAFNSACLRDTTGATYHPARLMACGGAISDLTTAGGSLDACNTAQLSGEICASTGADANPFAPICSQTTATAIIPSFDQVAVQVTFCNTNSDNSECELPAWKLHARNTDDTGRLDVLPQDGVNQNNPLTNYVVGTADGLNLGFDQSSVPNNISLFENGGLKLSDLDSVDAPAGDTDGVSFATFANSDSTDTTGGSDGTARNAPRYYAGLWNGTDLGAPLNSPQQSATWKGKIALVIFDTSYLHHTAGFDLVVEFGGTNGNTLIAENIPLTSDENFTINGKFTSAGVIYGTTTFESVGFESTGSLTGLIGVEGAVGAFVSTSETANAKGEYAGGFVAAPSDEGPVVVVNCTTDGEAPDPFNAACTSSTNYALQAQLCRDNDATHVTDLNTNCVMNIEVTNRVCATRGTYANPFNDVCVNQNNVKLQVCRGALSDLTAVGGSLESCNNAQLSGEICASMGDNANPFSPICYEPEATAYNPTFDRDATVNGFCLDTDSNAGANPFNPGCGSGLYDVARGAACVAGFVNSDCGAEGTPDTYINAFCGSDAGKTAEMGCPVRFRFIANIVFCMDGTQSTDSRCMDPDVAAITGPCLLDPFVSECAPYATEYEEEREARLATCRGSIKDIGDTPCKKTRPTICAPSATPFAPVCSITAGKWFNQQTTLVNTCAADETRQVEACNAIIVNLVTVADCIETPFRKACPDTSLWEGRQTAIVDNCAGDSGHADCSVSVTFGLTVASCIADPFNGNCSAAAFTNQRNALCDTTETSFNAHCLASDAIAGTRDGRPKDIAAERARRRLVANCSDASTANDAGCDTAVVAEQTTTLAQCIANPFLADCSADVIYRALLSSTDAVAKRDDLLAKCAVATRASNAICAMPIKGGQTIANCIDDSFHTDCSVETSYAFAAFGAYRGATCTTAATSFRDECDEATYAGTDTARAELALSCAVDSTGTGCGAGTIMVTSDKTVNACNTNPFADGCESPAFINARLESCKGASPHADCSVTDGQGYTNYVAGTETSLEGIYVEDNDETPENETYTYVEDNPLTTSIDESVAYQEGVTAMETVQENCRLVGVRLDSRICDDVIRPIADDLRTPFDESRVRVANNPDTDVDESRIRITQDDPNTYLDETRALVDNSVQASGLTLADAGAEGNATAGFVIAHLPTGRLAELRDANGNPIPGTDRYYAGLLSGTGVATVGGVLTAGDFPIPDAGNDVKGEWTAKLAIINDGRAVETADFKLDVNFTASTISAAGTRPVTTVTNGEPTQMIDPVTQKLEVDSEGNPVLRVTTTMTTVNEPTNFVTIAGGQFAIDGKFTAQGVIYGTTRLGDGQPNGESSRGSLTGLIGAQGAVGAFVSSGEGALINTYGEFAGGFVATAPVAFVPTPDNTAGVVSYADWVYGQELNSQERLSFTANTETPKNEFLAIRTDDTKLDEAGIPTISSTRRFSIDLTTIERTVDGTGGFSIFTHGGVAYAGILPNTDLGAPLGVKDVATTWRGAFYAVGGYEIDQNGFDTNVNGPFRRPADFLLEITFGGTDFGTIKGSFEISPASLASQARGNVHFLLEGTFNTSGYITGTVNFGKFDNGNLDTPAGRRATNGVLTGIIGKNGAVGAFISNPVPDNEPSTGDRNFIYSGGFAVARDNKPNYATFREFYTPRSDTRELHATHPATTDGGRFIEGTETGLVTANFDLTGNGYGPVAVRLGEVPSDHADYGSGFAVMRSNDNRYRVGLLSGTDLGAALDASVTANWSGKIYRLTHTVRSGSPLTSDDLTLTVDFADGTIETTDTTVRGRFNTGSANRDLPFGILDGTVNYGGSNVLAGLIGEKGVLGVFHGEVLGAHAGGFWAKPDGGEAVPYGPPATYEKWVASFTTGDNSGEELRTSTFANSDLDTGDYITLNGNNIVVGSKTFTNEPIRLNGATTSGQDGYESGFAYAFDDNTFQAYAGLLSTTNVGGALTQQPTDAIWAGKIAGSIFGDDFLNTFKLKVTFGTAGGTIRSLDGSDNEGASPVTTSRNLDFNGTFNDVGVMSGNVALDSAANGVFSGLIGAKGAVGVFNGSIENTGGYAGGFVVSNPGAPSN